MKLFPLNLAIMAVGLSTLSARAELIPPARTTTWTPASIAGGRTGVPGGIPANRTNIITVTADTTGNVDASGAIQTAITNAPPNSVVFLPAGTYKLSTGLVMSHNDSRVTLRGAGMGQTILAVQPGVTRAISIGTVFSYNFPANGKVLVPGTYNKDSAVITSSTPLTANDEFEVDRLILIQFEEQVNNAAIQGGAVPTVSVSGFSYGSHQSLLLQVSRIVSKNGNDLTIFPPIVRQHDAGLAAKIFRGAFSNVGMGVENLTIECGAADVFAGIVAGNSHHCWVKGVRINQPTNYGILFEQVANSEVRKTEIRTRKGNGSNGSGIMLNSSTANLIEDNIVLDIFPSIEVNQGSSGNVFAYNLFENPPRVINGVPTLSDTMNLNHGPHNSHNLYEGNIAANIKSDGYFGSASEDAVFRNWLHGSYKDKTQHSFIVSLKRFTRNYSLVGNIYGTGAFPSTNPYDLGSPNISNNLFTGTVEPTLADFWVDWKTTATLTSVVTQFQLDQNGNQVLNNGQPIPISTSGTFTLSAGSLSSLASGVSVSVPQSITIRHPDGTRVAENIGATTKVGNVVSFINGPATMPAVGIPLTVWWGPGGYQEFDNDVAKTTIQKGNYNAKTAVKEAMGGDALPQSLYLGAKPGWFGNLAWPPFDPDAPHTQISAPGAGNLNEAFKAIPSGYRYVTGQELPTAPYFISPPASSTNTVGTSVTFTASAEGFPLPTYKWKRNGQVITNGLDVATGVTYSGATTTSLTVSGLTFALNNSEFRAVAENEFSGVGIVTSVDSDPATLTVVKADQTISFAALTGKTFGNAPFTVTGSASSALPLTFSIASGPATISTTVNNVATVTITGAGNVTVRAVQAGDASFNSALDVDRSFTVAKAAATINFPAIIDCVFGDPTFQINLTATSGEPVSFQSSNTNVTTVSGTTFTVVGAGDTTITASAPANANYLAATAQQNFHVGKATATITFAALGQKQFGNAPFAVSGTSNNATTPIIFSIVGGPATISASSNNSATVTLTGAGQVTVRAAQATNANFNAATNVDRQFTVTPADQTITFAALTDRISTAGPFAVTATSTNNTIPVTFSIVGGPATISASNNNSATVTLTGTPGTVTVRASQVSNANFNAALNVDRQFTVTSPGTTPNAITFAALGGKTFGDVPFTVTGSASSSLPLTFSILSGPATISATVNNTATVTLTGAGDVIVRAGQEGDATFATATNVDRTFTVAKANQTITFGALAAKGTGDAAFAVSATNSAPLGLTFSIVSGPATVSATVNNSATVTLTGAAGTVVVRAAQAGNANYNAATNVDQSFVVTAPVVLPPPAPPPPPSGGGGGGGSSGPTFTTQPVAQTRSIGGEVVFTAVASGATSYQWFRNGSAIPGATSSNLAISDIQLGNAGTYHVVATNANGATASTSVALNVISAPTISSQPSSQTVISGANVTFSVTATGFPALSYQWRKNGTEIAGATSSSLSISNVQAADAGGYDVVVSNTQGIVVSNAAILAVNLPNYAGTYFGSFSGGGSWALYVRSDNTATYIATLPDRASAIVIELTINADGSFSITGTEINTQGAGSSSASTPPIAAAGSPFTLSGSISGGQVSGQLAGLGKTLSGSADTSGPASSSAGFYKASALVAASGTTYSIVGASGQTLVVTTSPTLIDAATGTLGANGQLNATTMSGGQVSVNVQSQKLAATYTPAGATTPVQFAGLNDTVTPVSSLINLSVRSTAGTGDRALIAGFVLSPGTSKNLLIRGIGPSLTQFGVTGALADPTITVFSGSTSLASNDDWNTAANAAQIASTTTAVGAFPLEAGSRDAVALLPISSGPYTAQVSGKGSATGVALLEVYDASSSGSARLINISARTQVEVNDGKLIVGFVVDGNVPKQILVRGIGPTLGTTFGVTGVLADPQLELFQGATRLQVNDNWGGTTALRTAFTQVGAFNLADAASRDAALLVTLQPGLYSAVLSGVGGTTGVGLIEIYILP